MADHRMLSLSWDLGPRTDFSNVAAIFAHLNAAVLFATDLQTTVDRQDAAAQILQNRSDLP
ncbi:hypothetical protein GCM10027414_14540 [Humibacter ginsengiterrae]